MKIKLNGWQRVGIVLNTIYLIIIVVFSWNAWPTQKRIESAWVYSALNAIVKPGTYAYELRQARFKDIPDRELIKKINIEYNANKVRGKMPTIQEVVNDPDFQALPHEEKRKVFIALDKDFPNLSPREQDKVINHYSGKPLTQPEAQTQSPSRKPIDIFFRQNPQQPSTVEQTGTPRPPDFEPIHSKIEVARKAGYSDSEIADYLAEKKNFDIQGARKAGYLDDEIINYFTYKNLKAVTDPFITAQLEGELITPGKKQSINLPEGFVLDDELQCQEKLKEVNLRYQKEIESLGKNRLRVVGISFTAWIIPSGIVYLLCLAIVWIYRGFKENKNLVN